MQKKQHNWLVLSNFGTLNIPLSETHVNILYCSPAAAALKGYSVHVLPHIQAQLLKNSLEKNTVFIRTSCRNRPAVLFRHSLRERQPDSGPSRLCVSGTVRSVKAVKQPFKVGRRIKMAAVPYTDVCFPLPADREFYSPLLIPIADRIVEKNGHHLLDLGLVSCNSKNFCSRENFSRRNGSCPGHRFRWTLSSMLSAMTTAAISTGSSGKNTVYPQRNTVIIPIKTERTDGSACCQFRPAYSRLSLE